MKENGSGKQIRYGALLSYFQIGIAIVVGLVYTPIMIRKLGQSEYGLYSTVASIISMLSILSLGFGSGYLKFFAKYKAHDDQESIYKLNGLFILVFSVIGIVALAIGLFLSFNLHLVYNTGLTDEEYKIAKVLMILLTINLSVSFPMSVFNTIICANEKFIFQKAVDMAKTVLSPILTLILLFCGMKSVALVLVAIIMAGLVDSVNIIYVFKSLKQKFYFNHFEKGIFKGLFVYTLFILINTLVKQINWNVDKVLLGRFQGTLIVAVYAVGSTLHTYYENFSTAISSVFRTKVHLIVNSTPKDSNEQRKTLTNLFVKVGRVQLFVIGLIATGLIFFGYDFIVKFWLKNAEYAESYYVCLLLVLPASIALIQNIGIDVQRALDRHKFRSIAYLIMSIINLILTIILCQIYGAIGAAIGTAISVFMVDGVIINIYYQKRCNLDVVVFWKNIIRCLLGFIPPCLIGVLLNQFIPTDNVWIYLSKMLIYVIMYVVSLWFLSFNKNEKQQVIKFIFSKKRINTK